MYILRGSGRFLMSAATGRRKYQMFVQTYNPFAVYPSVVRTARWCATKRAKAAFADGIYWFWVQSFTFL